MAQNNEGAATKRRRGPGRPFEKGQSGNPGGRPKTKVLSERLREALQENDGAAIRWIIARLVLQSAEGAVDATKLIFDRTEGKVAQPIIGDEEAPISVMFQLGKGPTKTPKEMTDEELEAARKQLDDDGHGN